MSLVSQLTPALPGTAQPPAEHAVVWLIQSQRWPQLHNQAITLVTYSTGHLWALGKETCLYFHLMDETAPGGRRNLFQSTDMSSSDGETHQALVLELVYD